MVVIMIITTNTTLPQPKNRRKAKNTDYYLYALHFLRSFIHLSRRGKTPYVFHTLEITVTVTTIDKFR